MPYFAWKGIDIAGCVKKGYLSAYDQEQLDKRLFDRHIALLSYRLCRRSRNKRSDLISDRVRVFDTLNILIEAGVSVPAALLLIADQVKHGNLQDALLMISAQLYAGSSLSKGCAQYPLLFNPLTIQLLKAGEESARLSEVCKGIAQYYQLIDNCYRRVKQALYMPIITIIFFMVICFFIVGIIVPRFAMLYQSMHQELPWFTRFLYSMGNIFEIKLILSIMLGMFSIGWLLKKWGPRMSFHCIEYFLIYIPSFNTILRLQMRNYFFHACSFLLQGGVPLIKALTCIRQTTASPLLQSALDQLMHEVMDGKSLSSALNIRATYLADTQDIAILQAGQEAGSISNSCKIIASRSYEQLIERITLLSNLIQPCVIICLGMLISGLLLALYLPIFSLSTASQMA